MGLCKMPTRAMMQDYAAATPRAFPHTCCLCMKECKDMKDWLSHQNTSLHLESCKLLRGQYPDWDGKTLDLLSAPGQGGQPSPATHGQNLQNRPQKSVYEARPRSASPRRRHGSEDGKEKQLSRSRSRSPPRHYGSESKRQKWSSRSRSPSPPRHQGQKETRSSRSPYASRHSRRSRSRSYDRPSSSRHRSRSRSYERRSPPRKREAKRASPRRSHERRLSPRRSDEKRSSPRRSRSSAERSEPQRTRSRSADRLAKRLLETSAVQSLSKTSDLEAMVKTLAPALLAELAKMKASTSSAEKKAPAKTTKATTGRPKTATSSALIPAASEPLSPDKVRLSSVYTSLTHNDILATMGTFGKVRDLVLCRSTLKGVVQFEKEEDAEKLKRLRSFQVKGLTVYVDKKTSAAPSIKPLLTKEQQAALQTKSAESKAKSQNTKVSPPGGVKTPGTSGAKNTATGKQVTKAKVGPAKGVAGKKSNTGGKGAAKSVEPKAGRDDPKPADAASEAAKVLKQSDTAAGEEDGGKEVAAQAKDVAPQAETSTNTEKAETQPATLAAKESTSKPGVSENQAAASEGKETSVAPEKAAASEKKRAERRDEGGTAGVKVEGVESGVTAPVETLKVVSSAESKESLLETSAKPAAGVKTPPRVSAPKASTDPPRRLQATVKTEERSVKDASAVRPRTQRKSESPAEKLKTKTEQQKSPTRTETKQEEAEGHRTTEPAGNVSVVKSEEPAAAEAKPADGAAVTKKMEDEETREEEKKTTRRETVASSMPSSGYPDSKGKTKTRASVSPSPAAPAEPKLLRGVKAKSTVSDTKAVKNETKVVAEPAVSRESGKKAGKKQPPRAPVSAAEKQTPTAPSTAAVSVTGSEKSEENDAELPHIDEDIFKAITAALREHRLKKGIKISENKESDTTSKTPSEGMEEENTSPTKDESEDGGRFFSRFDELDFSFGDFVTVDEISEDMDETALEETCSSSEETEGQSTEVPSATRKPTAGSSEDGERSASSSSTSVKGAGSLISTSAPAKKQTCSSEPDKSETTTSSASGGKTPLSIHPKTVETPPSSGQKAQSGNRKPPTRPSEPASSGPSTRSSAAAVEPSAGTQQAQKQAVKPTKSAATKPDHRVPVESCAAKTVESEMKVKMEKSQPPEGRGLQIPNQEADLKDKSDREVKEQKREMESKSTEEEIGQNEKDQVLDSLNKADEQKDEDDQDRKTETQTPGPEQDQLIHHGGLQGLESADKDKARSDECKEMETEEQTATADDGDDGPSRTQASENDETKGPEGPSVRGTSARDQATSEDSPNSVASNVKEDEILLAEKVCETSKQVGQISNEEDHPLDNKDALKDQKLVGPTDLGTKADDKPSEEEVYQVIDSLEDQPSKAKAESETEKKETPKKEGTPSGDNRMTRQGRSRGRTSKSEEKEQSTKKLDKTTSKPATRTTDKQAEREGREDFEDVVYEVLDSIEDDSVQETPATESSVRRRSARGNKNAEKTPTPAERGDGEEKTLTVLDSAKEKGSGDKPVVTRSTRGRKEIVPEKAEENAQKKEDKTATRRRPTPARDSQEKDREKTPKTESAPTKKTDSRHISEGETTYEVLDAVEGELVEPTTKTKRRGRPKKDTKTSKNTDVKKADSPIKAVEEAATYQILDSVEEESDILAPVGQSERAGKSTASADDHTTAAKSPSDEEEEPLYQILDSLEEDQFQEETTEDTSMQSKSETACDVVWSDPSAVEPSEQTGGEEKVLVRSADEPLEVQGSDARKEGSASKPIDKSSLNKPSSHVGAPAKKNDTDANNVLVNLDQVSEEEEDYPDDTAEEEELKKRQAAARKREKDLEKERETRERRSRSSSRGGGGRGKSPSQAESVCPEDLEKGELHVQDLVTLDEVGEDEVGEDAGTEAPTWAGDITEGELQELITLDEIAEEEEGAQNQESPSADSVIPESSSAVTESGQAEDQKDDEDDAKEPSSSPKRKRDDTREESGNFVTVDEVGEVREEEKQEVKAKGRPRKRSRQTQVRKSARGKNAKEEQQSLPPASLDPCPTPDSCTSAKSADAQAESQRTEKEKSAEAAAAADRQPRQPDGPDEQKVEGVEEVEEEHNRASFKVGDKRRQDLTGPKPKRSRSQSPSVAVDLQRPLFNPRNPRGQEFVVPKSGFFCELCSEFYLSENTAKEIHCSSRKHHDNLLKHYQKLQGKRWGTSTQSVQECLSD